MKSDVWVLDDKRAGTTNQSIALAEELGLKYEVKTIEYNILSLLPNIFFSLKPFHIKSKILQNFDLHDIPKIIISAGRRAAPVALYLKRHSKNDTKIIQIMKPRVQNLHEIDLIVLPQHDNIIIDFPRIVKIIGALCRLRLNNNPVLFSKNYPQLHEFIGVLIGGDSRQYKFSLREIKEFCRLLNAANSYHKLPLFISFSRRTPDLVKNYVKKTFPSPNIIYDLEPGNYNPYPDILHNAKFLIATADSISLCSEVASTGKPLYIYLSKNLKSKKHKFFIQQLIDLNVANLLEPKMDCLTEYYYEPLQEAAKVAAIIRTDILK